MAAKTVSFQPEPTTLNVNGETDIPLVANRENTIGFIPRRYLDELVEEWTLVPTERSLPGTYGELRELAKEGDSTLLFAANDGGNQHYGYEQAMVEAVVRTLAGTGGFDPGKFTLYRAANGPAPLVMVTDYVPDEFIIQTALGDRETFIEKAGGTACVECKTTWDDPAVYCPECQEYATAVEDALDVIREEIPGVLASVAPKFKDGTTSAKSTPDVDSIIEEYKEQTGDEYLQDEETLDHYLQVRGVIE